MPPETPTTISADSLLSFARAEMTLDALAEKLGLSLLETSRLLDEHEGDLLSLKRAFDLEYAAKLQALANNALAHLGEIAAGKSNLPVQARKACTDILRIHTSVAKKSAAKTAGRLEPAIVDELVMNARYKLPKDGFGDPQRLQVDIANRALEQLIRAAAKGPVRYTGLPEIRIECKAA